MSGEDRRLPRVPRRDPRRPDLHAGNDARPPRARDSYTVTVVAVDSLGAISAPSAPLKSRPNPRPRTGRRRPRCWPRPTRASTTSRPTTSRSAWCTRPTSNAGPGRGHRQRRSARHRLGGARDRGDAAAELPEPAREEQILNEPAAGRRMIEQLASLCETYRYQGIQVDFEGAPPAERNGFTAFITALAARLHEQGEKLSTIVTAKNENIKSGRAAMYNDAALSVVSDYVFVLDWGLHWTTSKPGGIDELPWFKKVAEYTATCPTGASSCSACRCTGSTGRTEAAPATPARHWSTATSALENEFGAHPRMGHRSRRSALLLHRNGVQHSVWYTDKQSSEARVALAQSLGLGSACGTWATRTSRSGKSPGWAGEAGADRARRWRSVCSGAVRDRRRADRVAIAPRRPLHRDPAGVRAGGRARLVGRPGGSRRGGRCGVSDLLRMRAPGAGADGARPTPKSRLRRRARIVELPRFSCQDGRPCTDPDRPALRARTLARLAEIAAPLVRGPEPRPRERRRPRTAMRSGVRRRARPRLHAEGHKLAVDVDGVTAKIPRPRAGLYDDRALAAAADNVFVMAWGTHWEGSWPGPIAPLSYVRASPVPRLAAPRAASCSARRCTASTGPSRRVVHPHSGRPRCSTPMCSPWPVGRGDPGARPAVDELTFAY